MSKDPLLEVDHHRLFQILACNIFESLVHRVFIDVVVAVFVGVKLDDESMTDALLEALSATLRRKWIVPYL
jgi:TRAP-type mannitol/chloroaromatic compound transport system permease large subunit